MVYLRPARQRKHNHKQSRQLPGGKEVREMKRCCRSCYHFDWSAVYQPGSRLEGVCIWWEELWDQGEEVRGPINPRPDHPACSMYEYNKAWRDNQKLHREIARQCGWL